MEAKQMGVWEQLKTRMDLIVFVCHVLGISVETMLHTNFGERYHSLAAFLVIPLIITLSLFFPSEDIGPLLGFLTLYILRCGTVRLGVMYRRWRRISLHSHYTGSPLIRHLLSGWKETTLKRWAEPLLVGTIGAAINEFNRPLGTYLMLAAVGLFISVQLTFMHERAKTLDVQDAIFEQTRVAERVREAHQS